MAATIYGLAALAREPGAVLREESNGLLTFTESQVGKTADVLAEFFLLERFVSVCADFAGLKLDSKQVLYEEGGQAKLQLVWAGTLYEEAPVLSEPVWFLKRTPSEEPIETHPDFKDFAGTASTPLNGAEFDETGLFKGFRVPSTGTNVFGGISKYLEFAATVTKTSVKVTSPDTSEIIPRINTPTGAPFTIPTITDRTWMKTDFTLTQRGAGFEVYEEWTMSGQRGWNTTIYP